MASNRKCSRVEEAIWSKELIRITLVNLFVFLGFQMLMPVLPVYSVTLSGTDTWAGLVVGIFSLSTLIMRPIAGRLADEKGRKGILLCGLGVFIVCVVSYMFVPSILFLLLVRVIHGFGWGASNTATNTIASDFIPKSRFAEGMGYFTLASTFAMAIGPALGLTLMNRYGFSTTFSVSGMCIVTALCIVFSVKIPKQHRALDQNKAGFFEKAALLPASLMFCTTMCYGAVVSFIVLYAHQRQIQNMGLFFTIYAVALLISRPFFGRIADKKGSAFALIPGMLLIVISMILLHYAYSLTTFLLAGICYGFGFGSVQPVLQALAVEKAAPNRRGAANATFFLGFDLGIGMGSIFWGAVVAVIGYDYLYMLALIPVVIAFVLYTQFILRRKKHAAGKT